MVVTCGTRLVVLITISLTAAEELVGDIWNHDGKFTNHGAYHETTADQLHPPSDLLTTNLTRQPLESKNNVFGGSCGGTFRTPRFRLKSSPLTNSVKKEIVCSYIIESFSASVCRLDINISTFEVGCVGEGGLYIGGQRLCGNLVGTHQFPFSQPRQIIVYRGDSLTYGRGFDLQVQQVECPMLLTSKGCGGVFSKPQFTLQTPNYPLNYPDSLNCDFLIRASSNSICDIDFFLQDFNLETSENCSKDRLEIGDHKVVCDNTTGLIRYHDFNGELRVKFISDSEFSGRGFRILVTQIPCEPQVPTVNSQLRVEAPVQFADSLHKTFAFTAPFLPSDQLPSPLPKGFPVTKNSRYTPFNSPNNPPTNLPLLPECCNQPYVDRHFVLSSPHFPHSQYGETDCIYRVQRLSPLVCGLRLVLRYFNIPCVNAWVDINGQRTCGCYTGQSLNVAFLPWETFKIIRYKSAAGIGKHNLQGFVIEVFQEECYRFRRNSASNVTIDQSYAKTRIKRCSTRQMTEAEVTGNDNPSRNFTSNKNITNLSLYTNSSFHKSCDESDAGNFEQTRKIPDEKPFTDIKNESLFQQKLSPNIPEGLSSRNPFISAINESLRTFSPILSSHISSLTSPMAITYDKTSRTMSSYTSGVTSEDKVGYFHPPSCQTGGFVQWLTLAKRFVWSGMATCSPPRPNPPPNFQCVVLNQLSGHIKSPGYPNGYSRNLNCCYRFQLAPRFCKVEMTMVDFDLERSPRCNKDFLLLSRKDRYCGQSLAGRSIVFDKHQSNAEDFRFVTDSYQAGRGFFGWFQQLPCATPLPPAPVCARVVTGITFQIAHITTNDVDRQCLFRVPTISPAVCQIQLSFARFTLICGRESLEIDGQSLCGDLTGQTRIFGVQGNELVMVFQTTLGGGRGFEVYGNQIDCIPFTLNVTPARIEVDPAQ